MMLAKALASASASAPKLYVEDVFSTWLYTGNGSTQTITNGIDLSGKGGLVWTKARGSATNHILYDTIRGGSKALITSTAGAELTYSDITFGSTGYSVANSSTVINSSSVTYVSWTLRKAAKFFDVVTYTGTGANRTIAHSLGSVPGCIIVKRTDTTGDWQVYHRSLANTEYLVLNTTAAKATGATRWNSTTPTSTEFSLGTDASVNASGGTYVAYLFAHNAGGFGVAGDQDVVTCGSYTGNGSASGPEINLGWEPQWILIKKINASATGWFIFDSTRGLFSSSDSDPYLQAQLADAESLALDLCALLPTGFKISATATGVNALNDTYIYIAIRRGPMKTPTDATKVFNAVARTGTGANATVTCGFQADAFFVDNRVNATLDTLFIPRLTGVNALFPTSTAVEAAQGVAVQTNPWDLMDGIKLGSTSSQSNANGFTFINYFFKRATSFFDVVTYSGTGANRTVSHNLGTTPDLILVKRRGATGAWAVYSSTLSNAEYLVLNTAAAKASASTYWNSTTPTASAFSLGTAADVNGSGAGNTFIAYLFASCPGVSKIGSYTGTAATIDVNCGFTNGARFVLIKRTDSTGDWYFWDTARGIVGGNDPYLLLNSSSTSEVTNTDYIDPLSSGFQISSTAPAAINANGGTYLYLAIA